VWRLSEEVEQVTAARLSGLAMEEVHFVLREEESLHFHLL
jgi:hypothetical protein